MLIQVISKSDWVATTNDTKMESSWAGLLEGDERGLNGLYDLLWEKLYIHASRILRDRDAAADVVQNLFIHLWETRTHLPKAANVEAYLFRCLKHAILNHIQATGVRDKHVHAYHAVLNKLSESTLDNLYQKELLQQIKDSSEALPLRMKEIFVMNRLEHKTVSEISRELNLSEQTVRNQINLAIKRIKPAIAGAALTLLIALRALI